VNTALVGITFSDSAALRQWALELELGCCLLSDADRSVALAYGAADSAGQEKPARVSVLVGADGRVVKTYASPDPAGHAAEVLADLGA
jgi:peroxiredoxin